MPVSSHFNVVFFAVGVNRVFLLQIRSCAVSFILTVSLLNVIG